MTDPFDKPDDPFRVLGVSQEAEDATIKQAYRRLVKACHPDLNPGRPQAEMRFKQVQQAYEAIMRDRGTPATGWDAPEYSGAFSQAAAGFQEAPDPFGGFYWMLKTYLSKRKP